MVITTIGLILFWSGWAVWLGSSRLTRRADRFGPRLASVASVVIGTTGLWYGLRLLHAIVSR